MSRLTKVGKSNVPPVVLKMLGIEDVPTECVEIIKTDSNPCNSVCEQYVCSECPIYEAFVKLAHYEDLEEQGRLVKIIRCKDCIRHGDEHIGAGWCYEHEHLTNDDDYCSYAVGRLAEMEGTE